MCETDPLLGEGGLGDLKAAYDLRNRKSQIEILSERFLVRSRMLSTGRF